MKKIFSFLYVWVFFLLGRKAFKQKKTIFFLSSISVKHKQCFFLNAYLCRSRIKILGVNNRLLIKGEMINSSIDIFGNNNRVIISEDCKIETSHIILRGEGCTFYIDEKSTFGGARIVCMGEKNIISIGKECMFSDNIEIWATDSHPIYQDGEIVNKSKPIIINDNVWVGSRVIVLKGVEIGENSVIGMGAVVTKNIDSNTLNVGNPAKTIKYISGWSRSFINS